MSRPGSKPALCTACMTTSSAASLDGSIGAKPPSSPTAVESAHLRQHLLERVEHLDAHAEAFGKGVGADRHDHELLRVDVVRRVRAAVEDVHHRHRQHPRHADRRDSGTAAARNPAPPRVPRRAIR